MTIAPWRTAATLPTNDPIRPADRRPGLSGDALLEVARELSRSLEPWPGADAPAERCWRIVEVTDCFEAWEVAWPVGGAIEFHDHGDSSGVVVVTSGRLVETSLRVGPDGRTVAAGMHAEQDASVEVDGERFRLPTSRDLAAVVGETDATRAAQSLLRRLQLTGGDVWSEAQIEAVGERLAEADPLAEIRLSFTCPRCEAGFEESLDLPSFVWSEMEARARRVLAEVHVLALAYGWSEAEILQLSPARREIYLDMVRA